MASRSVTREFQHPAVIRLTHWVNLLALGIMVCSGLRIYNASPLWNFTIPAWMTLGGWLAGARQWHFFGMWLFVLNGTLWTVYNIMTRHGRKTTIFSRSDLSGVIPMVLYYMRIRRDHPPVRKYNALQKLAYTSIGLVAAISVLSGLAIYWPVQFQTVARLLGNYEVARYWHFIAMAFIVLFFAGHLLMVAIAGWSNFLSMITGWKAQEEQR